MEQGTNRLPSGLVNSLNVGSEMTVWEIVWTGSSTQLTSFGRQDLMQRIVSVFSSLTLRETRERCIYVLKIIFFCVLQSRELETGCKYSSSSSKALTKAD